MLKSVSDESTGIFVVTTESGSQCLLDLERRTARRMLGPAGPNRLHLRRDGEDVDLVEVVRCEVGLPIILLIDLNLPDVWMTTRESSTVVAIETHTTSRIRR